MSRTILIIICIIAFTGCIEAQKGKKKKLGLTGQGITYSSLPVMTGNCLRSDMIGVCGNNNLADVSDTQAAGKKLFIVWNKDRDCNRSDINSPIAGESNANTQSVAGQSTLFENERFSYQNGETTILFGVYSYRVAIDIDGDRHIDVGEPIYCFYKTIDTELGALALNTAAGTDTSNWRAATAVDQSVFQAVGY